MKLRMEIIDQRNRVEVIEPVNDQRPLTKNYADLWAMIMGSIPSAAKSIAINTKPFEKAAIKEIEKVTAPEWGTKEWFYNTTMRDKEHQNHYVDSYGTVHYGSAFT